jgi:hypothetical protein
MGPINISCFIRFKIFLAVRFLVDDMNSSNFLIWNFLQSNLVITKMLVTGQICLLNPEYVLKYVISKLENIVILHLGLKK